MNGDDILSSEMGGESSVQNTKNIRTGFPELNTRNTGSAKNGNKVAQKEEKDCTETLSRRTSLSTRPSFVEVFMKTRRV